MSNALYRRHERLIVIALAVLAVARIALMAASYPFFANTDEQAHFDVVVKYARGFLPRPGELRYDVESANSIALYGSPEIYKAADAPKPLWHQPPGWQARATRPLVAFWTRAGNYEVYQPPGYYALAALWYRLGRAAGLDGLSILYWLRLLDGVFYLLLFGLAQRFCREHYPGNSELRVGVALLLAAFPQDVFYTISNDNLSPLVCLLALHLVVRIAASERTSTEQLTTGLVVGSVLLIKTTNILIMPIVAILLLWRMRSEQRSGTLNRAMPGLMRVTGAIAIPVLALLAWNAIVVGDVTGHHTAVIGWTPKPFAMRWDHPIFQLDGSMYFASELITTFWRGEMFWHGTRLASAGADVFYIVASLVCGLLATVHILTSGRREARAARMSDVVALLTPLAGAGVLFWISISYDFGEWAYPSSASPFFISGRLIGGALVPFVIMVCRGLEFMFSRLNRPEGTVYAAAFISLVAIGSELVISQSVFASSYNILNR